MWHSTRVSVADFSRKPGRGRKASLEQSNSQRAVLHGFNFQHVAIRASHPPVRICTRQRTRPQPVDERLSQASMANYYKRRTGSAYVEQLPLTGAADKSTQGGQSPHTRRGDAPRYDPDEQEDSPTPVWWGTNPSSRPSPYSKLFGR